MEKSTSNKRKISSKQSIISSRARQVRRLLIDATLLRELEKKLAKLGGKTGGSNSQKCDLHIQAINWARSFGFLGWFVGWWSVFPLLFCGEKWGRFRAVVKLD